MVGNEAGTPAWEGKVDAYKEGISLLKRQLPDVAEAYHQFTGECFKDGALPAGTKQLIALGMGLFANNEICTFYHVQEALSKGATAEEIMETVAVAAAIGGGHVMSQGATRVEQALQGPVH
ncbi:carboxymuconolactone decarboxylase family protein [Paenibacillus lutrae]|uniref:Carboxymuconolactone decarboxylase family protein n=1 Tax=Paenibacillus lutrae TaxID=2078573 RepID=A0A7X3FI80_9BACL|nr:carboxymuconolactone decarboxylase family protein [Paenibacillus lutrae]MVP00131.1 carboxymuconolactone decarboxylase family protein [Paenibacillus lutrae]